jgi:hypothetical protein
MKIKTNIDIVTKLVETKVEVKTHTVELTQREVFILRDILGGGESSKMAWAVLNSSNYVGATSGDIVGLTREIASLSGDLTAIVHEMQKNS